MSRDQKRAIGYLLVGSLSLFAPLLEGRVGQTVAALGTVGPLALVAVFALVVRRGPLFEIFATAKDREEGRLYSLASFAFAVTAVAVLVIGIDLSIIAFVAAVFVLTLGTLGRAFARTWIRSPVHGAAIFAVSGTIGGLVAILVSGALGAKPPAFSLLVFVAASGAVLGALIRSALSLRDDPLVLLSTALLIWFLLGLELDPSPRRIAIGLAVTVLLGYAAYALGTASVTGMLTGVLLALFAVVLGGYGWFVLLVSFFGLGGLASKYRYEEKLERGIAEQNEGARGGGNVLANSAVALVAIVAYAASDHIGLDPLLFQFAFSGAVAAALADTFSSEFGGLFDAPRLITTLEPVPPGTDGGVTWQGGVVGAVGSAIIAALAGLFFGFEPVAVATVLGAGFIGMVVDSILGATLEGEQVGNQGVNLLATFTAGLVAAAVAVFL